MKNIKVSRSYSAKIQLKQFEPIESWCAAEAEVEEMEMKHASELLDMFCRDEVEKTLKKFVVTISNIEVYDGNSAPKTPIPKFDYGDKKTLTEDQYQGHGTPKAPLAGGRYKGKKIDLRGEPVCSICGGTASNLRELVKGKHESCRLSESFKLKDNA